MLAPPRDGPFYARGVEAYGYLESLGLGCLFFLFLPRFSVSDCGRGRARAILTLDCWREDARNLTLTVEMVVDMVWQIATLERSAKDTEKDLPKWMKPQKVRVIQSIAPRDTDRISAPAGRDPRSCQFQMVHLPAEISSLTESTLDAISDRNFASALVVGNK